MKKQPLWEDVKNDKSNETLERLSETNKLNDLQYNINNTPDGIIRILRK